MYIKRHIEKQLKTVMNMYPAIMVTGARQVGKSTLLKNEITNIRYVTLDDLRTLGMATNDPMIFFDKHTPPIIIDEVQQEPKLFSAIKMIADRDKVNAQFFMTGSQAFHLMKNVTESMAGRVGILDLKGLSFREINGIDYIKCFLPTNEHIEVMGKLCPKLDYWQIWDTIHRGSFPKIYEHNYNPEQRAIFFNDYLQTYLTHDVRALTQVADERAFMAFITATAALTGKQLNYDTLAKAVGKDISTVKRWLSILITSGLVVLLEPYSDNILKRTAKTPKMHFIDTGLACYLCGWETPQQLERGAQAGAMLETWVVSEILKSFTNAGVEPRLSLFYYRDNDQREIDLVIKRGGKLYPIEIKKFGSPDRRDVTAFELLKKGSLPVGEGAVVCFDETSNYLTKDVRSIPVNMI